MDTNKEIEKMHQENLQESKNIKARIDDLKKRNDKLQVSMKKSSYDATQMPQKPKEDNK